MTYRYWAHKKQDPLYERVLLFMLFHSII